MSPETVGRAAPAPLPFGAEDMWALGVAIFRMCFGSFPFALVPVGDLEGRRDGRARAADAHVHAKGL